MLAYNEIQSKKLIELDGEPYQVLSASVVKKQRQKPVNKTKIKHLITGNVIEKTFQQSDTVSEPDIDKTEIQYIFSKPNRQQGTTEFWFADPKDPSNRFVVDESIIGEQYLYLKENSIVEALELEGTIVSITVPIKLSLKVAEAPPNIKGNTATGGNKQVTLETGAVVTTPMFVETGDTIIVNTEKGEYVERAKS